MALSDIDGKTIAMGALASLVGYVFYGFINLQAETRTIITKQNQVMSEQKDLWGKYNAEAMYKVEFMQQYYNSKLEDEKRWTEYWKDKAKDEQKK